MFDEKMSHLWTFFAKIMLRAANFPRNTAKGCLGLTLFHTFFNRKQNKHENSGYRARYLLIPRKTAKKTKNQICDPASQLPIK